MNKIRIIDLLNKIAKGEEVPKKIKYCKVSFEYNISEDDYFNKKYGFGLLDKINLFKNLTEEVEIIEEEKEIEKLNYKVEQLDKPSHNESLLMNMIRENKEAINKLIEELKKDK